MAPVSRRRFIYVAAVVPAAGACALSTSQFDGASGNADPDQLGTKAAGDAGATPTGPADASGARDTGVTTTPTGGPPPTDAGPSAADTGATTRTPPSGDAGAPACTPLATDLGPTSAFPLNAWSNGGSGRSTYVVGHDAGGYYVLSAVCTHSSHCTLDPPDSTGGQSCPCHGATFDPDGNVTRGPATIALANYLVAVCGGRLSADFTKTVPIGTRVKG
jgi:Rieske Fe-S protein